MTDTHRSSIWTTGQQTAPVQRRGRYLAESGRHPGKMLPAIARAAIATYTDPGDLVIDPMCGIGTTLVEAAHLGRDSIGIEFEPEWAAFARANLSHARAEDATGHGQVVVGDCRNLAAITSAEGGAPARLILTSPPYGHSTHGQVRAGHGTITKEHTRYSNDRRNLANASNATLLTALEGMLGDAARVLAPDGVVVLVARPWRQGAHLVDLPGSLTRIAGSAGLRLLERNVALLAALRSDVLVSRASFFALHQVRQARRAGLPLQVIAHEDVLVFGQA